VSRPLNEASRQRLAFARGLAPIYAVNPKVQAILVGGSVARGCADRYSDVEIGLFWEEPASDGELEAAFHQARGRRWELDPYVEAEDVRYEEYEAAGLKVDLRHMTVERMEAVLNAVLDDLDTDDERQQLVWVARHGIPLHGTERLARWKERAARYPEALAHAMVARHLSFPAWWSVAMYAQRGELPLLYQALGEVVHRIVGVLAGLNRLYHPGLKWLDRTIEEMALTPPDLAARIRRAYQSEPTAAAERMRQLVEETFTLVEQQMPPMAVGAARESFRYCRPVLDSVPSNPLADGARDGDT
jgi:hypothetical protein